MLPRPLDPIEIRVLGSLLEKEQTTPEYYPLTLNSLVAACNQKSNREPVIELSDGEVRDAIERLRAEVLVWQSEGARSERYEHNLDRRLNLDGATKALVTVLFLRGPQTPGELRTRCERMFAFTSLAQVEEQLRRLATGETPLVVELARAAGQKESRWAHLASGEVPNVAVPLATVTGAAESLTQRVSRLEAEVARLTEAFEELQDLVTRSS
jgi:uncharacterized protein